MKKNVVSLIVLGMLAMMIVAGCGSSGSGGKANSPPVINSIVASPNPVAKGGTVTISVNASDPDGDTLSYTWSIPAGWTIQSGGTTSQTTIVAPASYSITGTAQVSISDNHGGKAVGSITISTYDERSPIINSISVTPQPVTTTASLQCDASDIDGDTLSYTWNIGGIDVATGNPGLWTSPGIPGHYNAIVTVTDTAAHSVTAGTYVSISSLSPWPRFHRDSQSTGLSPINTIATTGVLKWSYLTGQSIFSSPAIGADGTIYVGSNDGKLYAINPNGTLKWSYTMNPMGIWTTPAIGADGTIYVSEDKLYAINPNGTLKWSSPIGSGTGYSSPAIGADGTIYVGADKLYAINPNGTPKWSYNMGNGFLSSPAIGADGSIYIGAGDYNLYAINPDGTEKWSYATGDMIYSSPAIGADGTIYVGSYDKSLYAINPDGTEKWSYATGDMIYSSPAIGADGTIYVGSYDMNLYAIAPTGGLKWSYTTDAGICASPAIGADGTIYVGSCNVTNFGQTIYAINQFGIKWKYTTSGPIHSSPAIGADGTIYVGSGDKSLYAIH
ncbi:MAG: PQQ-binding-like beta-propeller repeat protein [Deltaproteobacteria bacterium]|nr:PQQ-binding-like beta-propeller repeat protein [Deltaproteobacteria bacterium]MCL5278269.1 PQQ-binding-like beta-propeller repeat protein [Deltaproteobacteria bacterium]